MVPPPPIRRSNRLQPPTRRLELDSDIFSLATHPSERLLAFGESSGRVGIWGWPEEVEGTQEGSDDSDDPDEEHGQNIGDKTTLSDEQWWLKKWSTKRHKGSTRCVRFSGDGEGTLRPTLSILPARIDV